VTARPRGEGSSIVATGVASVVLPPGERTIDPSSFLKVRKGRKYMGVQDDLAVVAAGRALGDAGLAGERLGERAGLYLAVGFIPFLEEDIAPVLAASLDEKGDFSMSRFSAGGFQRAHPLLTFRCLPNMPAYHVSVCFDVQGPYVVTYPGVGQAYLALEQACAALSDGRVDVALVGGVAHQKNFLVEHHFRRVDAPIDELRDAAAFVVLERAGTPRGRWRLDALEIAYTPFDPTIERRRVTGGDAFVGPAAPFLALADGALEHAATTADGLRVASRWSAA